MEISQLKPILKANQVKAFANETSENLLGASPAVLKGVTGHFANKLHTANILTVRELLLAPEWSVRLNPEVLRLLTCIFYNLPGYDPGPPCNWEHQFRSAPLAYYTTHASNRFRIDFGPVFYRGRLNGKAKILIVGQDPSTDEILAQRAFVGKSGQRVQKLLHKIGITHSYVMFNAFLYGIFNQFDPQMQAISLEPTILNYRNSLFDQVKATNTLQLIISFGNGAEHAVNNWPGRTGITWIDLTHPAASDNFVSANWNAHLNALHAAVAPDDAALVDLSPYDAAMTNAEMAVPRTDLPFGMPEWHGAGGTRSHRTNNKTIIWTAP